MSKNWSDMSAKELKSECAERDIISGRGTKKEMIKRLKDYEKAQKKGEEEMPPIPRSLTVGQCNVVLLTQADIGEDDEMIEDARRALHDVLEDEPLEIERDIEPPTVGNQRGLSLANLPSEVAAHKARIAELESQNESLESELTARKSQHGIQLESLQARVADLSLSYEVHIRLRHRFITTSKRKKKIRLSAKDREYIAIGNQTAHGGDAIADARLYIGPEARNDYNSYKDLYGFEPQVVREFSHAGTISALNAHATVYASQRDVGSHKFYENFHNFVERFQKANYNGWLFDGDPTVVHEAYDAFVACRHSEVTAI